MQLIIKNEIVICWHDRDNAKPSDYPDCEVVFYTGTQQIPPASINPRFDTTFPDPRTQAEKDAAYQSQRQFAYPTTGDQLDMLFHAINGLASNNPVKAGLLDWLAAIATIKNQFPKP